MFWQRLRKNKTHNNDSLIKNIIGIGDILVYETKRERNERVEEWLDKIRDIINIMLSKFTSNPDKHLNDIYSFEFLDVMQNNRFHASLLIEMKPDIYMPLLTKPMDQIKRIYMVSLELRNERICLASSYRFNYVLADLVKHTKGSEHLIHYVKYILRTIYDLTVHAINGNNKSKYTLAYSWYTNVLYTGFGQKETDFNLEYLELFNKSFIQICQLIITKNEEDLFKALMHSLVTSITSPYSVKANLFKYHQFVYDIENRNKFEKLKAKGMLDKLNNLVNSFDAIDSKKDYEIWTREFIVFRNSISEYIIENYREDEDNNANEILNAASYQIKESFFKESIYAISAYCMFKEKYEYLRYMWEAKQPPDAMGSILGHNIIPESIEEAVDFYFKKDNWNRNIIFGEGFHGSEMYCERYILLLLCFLLKHEEKNIDEKYDKIENYLLPNYDNTRFNFIKESIVGLVAKAEDLKRSTNIFIKLGFDKEKIDEIVDHKLIALLKRIKTLAESRLIQREIDQGISEKKVEEFRKKVVKGFYNLANLRKVFEIYGHYEERLKETLPDNFERKGIKQIDVKNQFFDDWHVHYIKWGEVYGEGVALGENKFIIEKIEAACEVLEVDTFDNALRKAVKQFEEKIDLMMFVKNTDLVEYFTKSPNFKPNWVNDCPQLEVPGFMGVLYYENLQIQVIEVYFKQPEKDIIILDASKIGTFIQYSPVKDSKDESKKEDVLFIDVKECIEEADFIKRIKAEPPEWLTKEGDWEQQKAVLATRVLISVFIAVDYEIGDEFQGFRLKIKE